MSALANQRRVCLVSWTLIPPAPSQVLSFSLSCVAATRRLISTSFNRPRWGVAVLVSEPHGNRAVTVKGRGPDRISDDLAHFSVIDTQECVDFLQYNTPLVYLCSG